ncbi:MAG: hypothetical protein QF524_07540, partial [Planctomycetota bacterium]|nr:hypothetical protein [Planctomycetota bacterium]
MSPFRFTLLLWILAGCSTPSLVESPKLNISGVAAVQINGASLNPQAFSAEAEFLFPEEMQAVRRALLRSEIARLEGTRLQIEIPPEEIQRTLEQTVQDLESNLGGRDHFEAWCQSRWGCSRAGFEVSLRQRLADNLLYQRVMRAGSFQDGSWVVLAVSARSFEEAEDFGERLQLGADPREWGVPVQKEVLQSYCVEPIAGELDSAEAGDVIGPFRLEGDSNWFLFRILESRAKTEYL